MIQCNGKCAECSAYLNGEIESFESCAISTMQRRTFDMNQKIANIEQLIIQLIGLSEEKKGKKLVPVKSDDIINKRNTIENEYDKSNGAVAIGGDEIESE